MSCPGVMFAQTQEKEEEPKRKKCGDIGMNGCEGSEWYMEWAWSRTEGRIVLIGDNAFFVHRIDLDEGQGLSCVRDGYQNGNCLAKL